MSNAHKMQGKSNSISLFFLFVIAIYQFIWHFAIPIVLIRLWWKAQKEPKYLEHIAERFGFYRKSEFKNHVWIHAVSVGETRATEPLIRMLIDKGHSILLTHTTPTGRQTGMALFESYIQQEKLKQVYLPYDFCWPVSRFYHQFKPRIGMLMETEVWPSVLFFSRGRLPIYLINGRLSARSSLKFSRFGKLSCQLFGLFDGVFAQTRSDAEEYKKFGVTNCRITGNLKFDVPLDKTQQEYGELWKKKLVGKQIIVLASSRDGEEKFIIQAWQKINQRQKTLLVIVPRHLTRLAEIEKFLQDQAIQFVKRSTLENISEISEEILIGDTMGEMAMYLSMADYVIMGGSWLGTGGQNLIEPISIGKPVILGPSTYNFADISQFAVQAGVAIQAQNLSVQDLDLFLVKTMQELLESPTELDLLREKCRDFAKSHQGATLKTINHLQL
jgi:3-deoxy-D-manno-octulosonic-acid transferase